nr:putative colanic acid biosynthesis acetyltransferase [Leptolyngbya sp. FACHB-711]
MMQLDRYTVGSYTPGAPYWKQLLWYFIGSPLVQSYWLPMSAIKVWILRRFGAQMGQGVRIKPGVRVKFPWRLSIGDYVWLGEDAWIDNLAPITVDSHVCISQSVYLCTGNHDWSHPQFELKIAPIHIAESSWIAARAIIGPGVTVGKGAVLGLGGVTGRSLEAMTIYSGNPAQPIKVRKMKSVAGLKKVPSGEKTAIEVQEA